MQTTQLCEYRPIISNSAYFLNGKVLGDNVGYN